MSKEDLSLNFVAELVEIFHMFGIILNNKEQDKILDITLELD